MGDNGARAVIAGLFEGGENFRHGMAIDLTGIPAKGGPFFGERFHLHDVAGAACGLPSVEIHQHCERGGFKLWSKHGRFPHAAFLALPVAHEHKCGMGVLLNG